MQASKKIKNSVGCLVFVCLVLFSSCNKNTKRGCTDKDGENYRPSANIDCGCCFYYGKVLLWYNYDYYFDYLDPTGTTNLYFYANNQKVGQTSKDLISHTRSSAPVFNANSFLICDITDDYYENVILLPLGAQKTKLVLLKVIDQNGKKLWEDSVNVQGNKVISQQIP